MLPITALNFRTSTPQCESAFPKANVELKAKLRAKSLPPQTLLIDADDTLWENNIYFERAIARFISFLNHHEFSAEQVREVLNDVERECIVKHGYGLHSFAHALVDTFERLSVIPVTSESARSDSRVSPNHVESCH